MRSSLYSMRRLAVLVVPAFLLLAPLPILASHRTTVAELEAELNAACAEHRSDADIAKMVSKMELSQRLDRVALERLAHQLPIQPETAVALVLLSDQSAFLDPPPSDMPAAQPPDAATQQHILDLARGYVLQTMQRLPNFFASRTVHRFDDTPYAPHAGDIPIHAGLHPAQFSSRPVAFRDGKEVVDTPDAKDASFVPDQGLYSTGEFGPILAQVFTDLAKGRVQFSHWEQGSLGVVAVYRFKVPKSDSHYMVHFCCVSKSEIMASRMGVSSSGPVNIPQAVTVRPIDTTPAYHGSISIDPTSGAVLRIAIEAELKSGDPIERAATVVEYGRVNIGGQDFICPVRSLAISLQPPEADPGVAFLPPSTLRINESTFTGYHRLGTSVRVIADGSQPAGSTNPAAASIPALTAAPAEEAQSSPATGSESAPAAAAQPSAEQVAAAAAPESAPAAPPPSQPSAAAAPPVTPEISMAAATGIPDIPANPNSGYSLKIAARLVDIGAIVYDKHGHPVTDFKQDDFELYDNGHKQDIRFFSAPGALPELPTASQPATSFSNRATDAAAPAAAIPAGTILLIDEGHVAWTDLNNARGQMLKFLSRIPADQPVGIYVMSRLGFRVLAELTTDHAALEASLKSYMPSAQSMAEAQEEERRNRQSFDYVHNVNDLLSVNGNHYNVADSASPIDPELLTMGDNPARADFIILSQVARHLASIPGHKSLVWVSSDNVFADWQDQAVGIDKSPKMVESYGQRAQEAMNQAHAAVYPFDVSQLEAGGVGAELQNANVELTPEEKENPKPPPGDVAAAQALEEENRIQRTANGRVNAAMSQDVHPIQGAVRDVATGTGGRAIPRSADLAAQLARIVEEGQASYQLSFYPQGAPDDKYHNLTIKLVGHRGFTVRYRTGYLFAAEPASMKDRFRQAVWQPMDTSEIGVSAGVAAASDGSSIKIKIATGDLAMQQQGGRWMDKLDIFYIQRDDAGIHARVEGTTLGLRLLPLTYQTILPTGVPFEHSVAMQPGMGSLRVLVIDEKSGRMGSVTIPSRALQVARR